MISEKSQDGDENLTLILKTLAEHPYASVRQIGKLTGIPKSTVFDALTRKLHYKLYHLRWIPHSLNSDQKENRVELSKLLLETIQRAKEDFYSFFFIGDESWFCLETSYETIWLPKGEIIPEREKK